MRQDMKEALDRYAQDGIETGGFLRAVLENNLYKAFSRADYQNRTDLFNIVCYVYNELPMNCWGSPEKVDKWLKMKKGENND